VGEACPIHKKQEEVEEKISLKEGINHITTKV
jgi:hypothetical protein